MIQPLRVVHRWAFVMLAPVLSAVLLIGLAARHSRSGPTARGADAPVGMYVVRESSNMWQKHTIQSKFYSKSDRPQDIYLVLQPAKELNEPDLLLYWATNGLDGNVLPAGAQFVGVFAMGKAVLLPPQDKGTGNLVLFSRAHQTAFDTARVEKLP
jgi:hypothetical protein